MIGIDRAKMRFYDVADNTSVMDVEEEEMPQFSETQILII